LIPGALAWEIFLRFPWSVGKLKGLVRGRVGAHGGTLSIMLNLKAVMVRF